MHEHVNPLNLAANWEAVQARIDNACLRSRRARDQIAVVAVTKTYPLAITRKAYALGIRHFGENRVQEAVEKYSNSTISNLFPEAKLHLVGHLQRNKVRKCLQVFDNIDSIDSVDLANHLDREAGAVGRSVRVLLEVNTSGEPQKYGIEPESTLHLAGMVMGCRNLQLAGLMTVGPNTDDREQIRAGFRLLRELYQTVQARLQPEFWSVLSMGMSGDFEIAIEEGATEVRLGTVLFGERSTV